MSSEAETKIMGSMILHKIGSVARLMVVGELSLEQICQVEAIVDLISVNPEADNEFMIFCNEMVMKYDGRGCSNVRR